MGYTTDFSGDFAVTPALKPEHRNYLETFNETRRMKRNPEITKAFPDPIREAVGLPIGPDGAFYVGAPGSFGQDKTPDVVDYNTAPGAVDSGTFYKAGGDWYAAYQEAERKAVENGAQPGLWCQWKPNEDGTAIVWDEGEKFYEYVPWLKYLIDHFLAPWGYALDGEVTWQGEEHDDRGMIRVTNNVITILRAEYTLVEQESN